MTPQNAASATYSLWLEVVALELHLLALHEHLTRADARRFPFPAEPSRFARELVPVEVPDEGGFLIAYA